MEELTRKAFNWRISNERFNVWLDAQSNRTAALEYLVDVFQRKYGNVDILQPRRQYAIEVELGLEIDLAKKIREKNQLLKSLAEAGFKIVPDAATDTPLTIEEALDSTTLPLTEQKIPTETKVEEVDGNSNTTELSPNDLMDF